MVAILRARVALMVALRKPSRSGVSEWAVWLLSAEVSRVESGKWLSNRSSRLDHQCDPGRTRELEMWARMHACVHASCCARREAALVFVERALRQGAKRLPVPPKSGV